MPDPTKVVILGPQTASVIGSEQKITKITFDRVGPRGADGLDGTSVFAIGETPGGNIDGVNTDFFTAFPIINGQLMPYLNGLRQTEGNDYNPISNTSFRMVYPPQPGDDLTVDYVRE